MCLYAISHVEREKIGLGGLYTGLTVILDSYHDILYLVYTLYMVPGLVFFSFLERNSL